jgi:hypothetical protein
MNAIAAIALSCMLQGPHNGHEHGAIIVQDAAGNLLCTNRTEGTEDRLAINVKPPVGYSLVALVHTHVMPEYSEYFSEQDVIVADRLNVPSYILVDGRLRGYTPGKTKMIPPSHLSGALQGKHITLGDLQ